MSILLFRIVAALCFLAVALGAFGAHAFSGSLYVMALTNLRRLDAITPLDGLCFLAGWAWLVVAPPR